MDNPTVKIVRWQKYKSFLVVNKQTNKTRPRKVPIVCKHFNNCAGNNYQIIAGKCKTKGSFWYSRVVLQIDR